MKKGDLDHLTEEQVIAMYQDARTKQKAIMEKSKKIREDYKNGEITCEQFYDKMDSEIHTDEYRELTNTVIQCARKFNEYESFHQHLRNYKEE